MLDTRTGPQGPSDSDDRGVVLVISALAMVALLVIAAFAIDLGHARQVARNEQAATDGASLAAAQSLPVGGPDAVASADARELARSNIASTLNRAATACVATDSSTCEFEVGDVHVKVQTPYHLAGSSIPDYGLVFVEACGPSPAFFSRVIGHEETTVCRSSVARHFQTQPGVGIGIIALGPSDCTVTLNGTVNVTVEGGAVLANSNGSPAICAQGAGCGTLHIDAVLVAAAGTVAECIQDHTSGEVVSGAQQVPDPFGHLPDSPCVTNDAGPAAMACGSTPPVKPTTPGVCGTAMSPGYFPSGCTINGNNTIDLAPGIYWFDNPFSPGNGELRCTTCSAATGGVLLYFFHGSLTHNGNLVMNLLPYQSGQPRGDLYAGLSIYQRRGNEAELDLGGTGAQTLGSIYAKGALIEMHGTPGRVVDGLIAAARYRWVGSSTNTVNPPASGPTTEPIVDMGLQR